MSVQTYLNNILDNKEIAYLIWGVIGISFLLLYKTTRDSISKFICSLLGLRFVVIYFLTISYVTIFLFLLYKLNLWDFSLLKETILWVIIAGSMMIYKIAKTSDNKKFFIAVLKDNLKWTVAFEFVIGLYSFNIWFEFFSVPISFFISFLIVLSERDEKHLKQAAILKNIVSITAVVIVFYIVSKLIYDYHKYLNIGTLHLFLLPPMLTILFLPFAFLLSLYFNYAAVFAVIKNQITPIYLLQYTKLQAIIKFNLNITGLQRWRYNVFLKPIHKREDVQQSMNKIINLQKIEKDPPEIEEHLGWSPYVAKDFLKENNIVTGYYSNNSDNEWFADSSYIKLDDNILSNKISYYIEGTEKIANSLSLVLDIYDRSLKTNANETFLLNSETLYKKVFNKPLPENLKINILNGCNFVVFENLFEISLNKEEWTKQTHGYNLSFRVKYIAV